MNKWIRRALKLLVYVILWFVIGSIGGFLNKVYYSGNVIPPIFLFAAFVVPGFLCYSKWANKEIWKKPQS
jgi:hypothetical protein